VNDDQREHPAPVASPGDGSNRNDELAVQLAEVARALEDQDNAQDTLDEIVRAAVDTIPGARDAGIMMVVDRRDVRTVSQTGDVVGQVDQAQYDTAQGPCLTGLYERKTVTMPDTAAEQRWPAFTERARELDVAAMVSFRLFVTDNDLGALNLYSSEPHAFDEDAEHVGLLFATHAAVALAGALQQEHLTQAVHGRDLIGQAKGILMERHKLTGDQAFTVLVRTSQRTNTKLRDLATHLVHTGELPTAPR
jgi:GAF domain-containing protein